MRIGVTNRAMLGIGASTYHLYWPAGSHPPPIWGAEDEVELVHVEVQVVGLHPLIDELLPVGEHAPVILQHERGVSTWM